MLLKEHKDLKVAILSIPLKEKDKLLLRLIAKDKILTEHLHFKLLEDVLDLQKRHEDLKTEIDNSIHMLLFDKKPSAKDVLAMLRKLNGKINHHYKVTKEINSEVELRIHLLNVIPLNLREGLFSYSNAYTDKLINYFLRTAKSAFVKYSKLHEDLQFDLKDEGESVLKKINQFKLTGHAASLGLPTDL
jgi:hypothetical protein